MARNKSNPWLEHISEKRSSFKLALKWLYFASIMGYEVGFYGPSSRGKIICEAQGWIERDPTSRGRSTHWRITDSGERAYQGFHKRGLIG